MRYNLDDKNYEFHVLDLGMDTSRGIEVCTISVYQKTRTGKVFVNDFVRVDKSKVESVAKLVKAMCPPIGK